MSIVTISATVSHRYYEKKSKAEIIRRIGELRTFAGLTSATPEYEAQLKTMTASRLAEIAMSLHRMLPE